MERYLRVNLLGPGRGLTPQVGISGRARLWCRATDVF